MILGSGVWPRARSLAVSQGEALEKPKTEQGVAEIELGAFNSFFISLDTCFLVFVLQSQML
jgi:hypothetical protein